MLRGYVRDHGCGFHSRHAGAGDGVMGALFFLQCGCAGANQDAQHVGNRQVAGTGAVSNLLKEHLRVWDRSIRQRSKQRSAGWRDRFHFQWAAGNRAHLLIKPPWLARAGEFLHAHRE